MQTHTPSLTQAPIKAIVPQKQDNQSSSDELIPTHIAKAKSTANAGYIVQSLPHTKTQLLKVYKTGEEPAVKRLNHQLITSASWQNSMARDHHQQTFALAREALDRQLDTIEQNSTRTTPVLFTDIDDMLLNSLPFFGGLISHSRRMNTLSSITWWLEQVRHPLQGAVDFLAHAHKRNALIHYITAREDHKKLYKATIKLLRECDFPQAIQSHVHIASDKAATAEKVLADLRQEGRHPECVFMAGDKATDVGYPRTTNEAKEAWMQANKDKIGHIYFIQPNPVYGSWERVAHNRYEKPANEHRQRRKQLESLAGKPKERLPSLIGKAPASGSSSQAQAVLYSASLERSMIVRQVLAAAETRLKAACETQTNPVVYVQLEGVLLDTSAYVAELVLQGAYADHTTLTQGTFTEWLDSGVVRPEPQIQEFVKNAKARGATVIYKTTPTDKGCLQEHMSTVCHWLRANHIDQEPQIKTTDHFYEPGLCLLTTHPQAKSSHGCDVLLIPAPHQMWEWWDSKTNGKSAAEQMLIPLPKWVMQDECRSGVAKEMMERQRIEELEVVI